MSTRTRASDHETPRVEVITDDEASTVTFVADLDRENKIAPTEWITVAADDLVDLEARR